jgi:hypothetical protein
VRHKLTPQTLNPKLRQVAAVRRDVKLEADELARQQQALLAVRESLDAREADARRKQEEATRCLEEARQASASLQELDLRRTQVQDAIAHLRCVKRALCRATKEPYSGTKEPYSALYTLPAYVWAPWVCKTSPVSRIKAPWIARKGYLRFFPTRCCPQP